MHYRDYFQNKKITLMGLGVLGRGVGDAEFLAQCGAELIVTDLKTKKELSKSVWRLKKYKNIKFSLGGHNMKDFQKRDIIIKSAGVPLDSPYIQEAHHHKISVTMSTALFVKLLPEGATVIGVTGTRGKSTVTHLIYQMLKVAGKRVFLGGNVKGVSTLAFLPKIKKGDYVVLELDSWQLQGFHDEKISPHIAVFTNFMMDHMNYYKGNAKKYFYDKSAIFKYQTEYDYLIVSRKVFRYIETSAKKKMKSKIVIPDLLPKAWDLFILGVHNRENASCVVAVGNVLKIKPEHIKKTLVTFTGVPGRLQFLREVRGVKIYNDTTATTPDATVAALKALGSRRLGVRKNIILICGGADKKLNMSKLVKEIPKHCKAIILLPGSGTEKFQVSSFKFQVHKVLNLKEAVGVAMGEAEKGDSILFSPAFASFGPPPGGFKNEYDRNDQFVSIIKKL